MANLKFSFFEGGPGSVHIPSKQTFLFKFSNFEGYTENAPNHILSSNSAGKILKMAIKFEPIGLCSWIFGIFYSQWDNQMVNIPRILKFLTWHGFDEFDWNDPFWNWSKALCLGDSEPTNRLAARRTAYALRNQQVKQAKSEKLPAIYNCKV